MAVELMDEITMRSSFGFTTVIFPGEGRQMNRLSGMKKKEWFFTFAFRLTFNEVDTLLQKYIIHFL